MLGPSIPSGSFMTLPLISCPHYISYVQIVLSENQCQLFIIMKTLQSMIEHVQYFFPIHPQKMRNDI